MKAYNFYQEKKENESANQFKNSKMLASFDASNMSLKLHGMNAKESSKNGKDDLVNYLSIGIKNKNAQDQSQKHEKNEKQNDMISRSNLRKSKSKQANRLVNFKKHAELGEKEDEFQSIIVLQQQHLKQSNEEIKRLRDLIIQYEENNERLARQSEQNILKFNSYLRDAERNTNLKDQKIDEYIEEIKAKDQKIKEICKKLEQKDKEIELFKSQKKMLEKKCKMIEDQMTVCKKGAKKQDQQLNCKKEKNQREVEKLQQIMRELEHKIKNKDVEIKHIQNSSNQTQNSLHRKCNNLSHRINVLLKDNKEKEENLIKTNKLNEELCQKILISQQNQLIESANCQKLFHQNKCQEQLLQKLKQENQKQTQLQVKTREQFQKQILFLKTKIDLMRQAQDDMTSKFLQEIQNYKCKSNLQKPKIEQQKPMNTMNNVQHRMALLLISKDNQIQLLEKQNRRLGKQLQELKHQFETLLYEIETNRIHDQNHHNLMQMAERQRVKSYVFSKTAFEKQKMNVKSNQTNCSSTSSKFFNKYSIPISPRYSNKSRCVSLASQHKTQKKFEQKCTPKNVMEAIKNQENILRKLEEKVDHIAYGQKFNEGSQANHNETEDQNYDYYDEGHQNQCQSKNFETQCFSNKEKSRIKMSRYKELKINPSEQDDSYDSNNTKPNSFMLKPETLQFQRRFDAKRFPNQRKK